MWHGAFNYNQWLHQDGPELPRREPGLGSRRRQLTSPGHSRQSGLRAAFRFVPGPDGSCPGDLVLAYKTATMDTDTHRKHTSPLSLPHWIGIMARSVPIVLSPGYKVALSPDHS